MSKKWIVLIEILTCVVGFLLVQFAGNQVLKELRAG